jgi:hypothetical protein
LQQHIANKTLNETIVTLGEGIDCYISGFYWWLLMLQFVTLSVATAPLHALWYIKRNWCISSFYMATLKDHSHHLNRFHLTSDVWCLTPFYILWRKQCLYVQIMTIHDANIVHFGDVVISFPNDCFFFLSWGGTRQTKSNWNKRITLVTYCFLKAVVFPGE